MWDIIHIFLCNRNNPNPQQLDTTRRQKYVQAWSVTKMYSDCVSRLRSKMNLSSKWATLCLHKTRWFWSTRTFPGKHQLWYWIICYFKNKKTNRRGSYGRPRKQNFTGVYAYLVNIWLTIHLSAYIHIRLMTSTVSSQNES